MVPTHCPNCGAAITEQNSGKFCVYCGGKLPEPEQMIINNNDNREIHYHTTIIQQAPAPAAKPTPQRAVKVPEPPKEQPLPKDERIKETPKIKKLAFIATIVLIVVAIASGTAILAVIAAITMTISIVKPDRTNYCPYCFYRKELYERKCKHCGKTIESGILRIAAALMADAIVLFIAVAIAAAPK